MKAAKAVLALVLITLALSSSKADDDVSQEDLDNAATWSGSGGPSPSSTCGGPVVVGAYYILTVGLGANGGGTYATVTFQSGASYEIRWLNATAGGLTQTGSEMAANRSLEFVKAVVLGQLVLSSWHYQAQSGDDALPTISMTSNTDPAAPSHFTSLGIGATCATTTPWAQVVGHWDNVAGNGNRRVMAVLQDAFYGVQPPTGLACVATTPTSILVNWTAAELGPNASAYNLFRDGVLIGSPTATSFNDTNVSVWSSYNYTLNATNGVENSTLVGPITCSTVGPPTAPFLTGSFVACSTLALNWSLPAGAPDSYNVSRSASVGINRSFLVPPNGDFTNRTFNDTVPPLLTTISWSVSAHNSGGWGASSNVVTYAPTNATTLGACGLIFGGDRTSLAGEMSISVSALDLMFSLIIVAIGLSFGYFSTASVKGAGVGGAAGILVSVAFGLLPLWAVLFVVGIGGMVFVLGRR